MSQMCLFDACRCASQFCVEAQAEHAPQPHVSFGRKMRGGTCGFPTASCMPSTLQDFVACKTLVAHSRGGTRGGKISNVGVSQEMGDFCWGRRIACPHFGVELLHVLQVVFLRKRRRCDCCSENKPKTEAIDMSMRFAFCQATDR